MQYTLSANQTLSIPTNSKRYAAIALISDLGEIRYKTAATVAATLPATSVNHDTLNTNVRTDYIQLDQPVLQIRAVSASTIQVRLED